MDQSAFRRQQLAGTPGLLRAPVIETVSPHAAPTEGALRSVPPTVPGGGNEPRLLMPRLGRTSTFVTDLDRLALTNEASPVARSAGPWRGCPLVGDGSTAVPLTVSTV